MPKSVLVIDIGTSSAKAVLFGPGGRILAEGEHAYPTSSPGRGEQEQDPEDWWRAARAAVALLGPLDGVELISLAGTMQSVIPVDGDGAPLRPAILYSDSRALKEFARLGGAFDGAGAEQILANRPNEFMSAFKMAWLATHEPEAFQAAATFHTGAKDFLLQRLTGCRATDPTAASTVGLMAMDTQCWDEALLQLTGVAESRLPAIRAANQVIGPLRAEAARELGLKPGTPVLNGCGDAGASTLGAGIRNPGETYVYVGTTAWAAQIVSKCPRRDSDIYTLAHPSDASFIRIGAMLSGGDSAAWFSEVSGQSFEVLEGGLDAIDEAPSRALFLPYLKGERCPFNDPAVRASFLLMDRSDDAASMYYAVLEGVAFAIKANLQALQPASSDLSLLGGGALSRHLPQLLADACDRAVVLADTPTAATAFGAYGLAADHLGWSRERAAPTRRVLPRPDRTERARRRFDCFIEATRAARLLSMVC